MSAQHTPGPWERATWTGTLAGAHEHAGIHEAVWHGFDLICATGIVGAPESAENAALIAAAPDLLAALDRIDGLMRDCLLGPTPLATDEQVQSILDAQRELRTAIAKARGQA